MSVLIEFVKFLLSFHNQDTKSFKNTKKVFLPPYQAVTLYLPVSCQSDKNYVP